MLGSGSSLSFCVWDGGDVSIWTMKIDSGSCGMSAQWVRFVILAEANECFECSIDIR